MFKAFLGFLAGLMFVSIAGYVMMPKLMFSERASPFGLEETVARIQHNIEDSPVLKEKG